MKRPEVLITDAKGWRTPYAMLAVMAGAMFLSFSGWSALLNNFSVERAGFTGREMGILQSIREIPGFLAFLAIFVVIVMREQTLALVSLTLLGLGVAVTGYYPSVGGLFLTTFVMSLGFHYYETMALSLSLQWLPKATAPAQLGKLIAIGSFSQLAAYALVYLAWKTFGLSYELMFLVAGLVTVGIAVFLWIAFPNFREEVPQSRKPVLRARYWLYYALTFMGGARRQIFVVFAGFMMVEKFGYAVHEIAALFFLNGVISMVVAPKIGSLIGRFGERKALVFEYIGLIGVFTAYAFVDNVWIAAGLYVIDHAFFAMAIAMKTYFQKIADPVDIAQTAGVSFTINHIAAVVIPALFGLIWLVSPALVFLLGAAMSAMSLGLALLVPENPEPGREVIFKRPVPAIAE